MAQYSPGSGGVNWEKGGADDRKETARRPDGPPGGPASSVSLFLLGRAVPASVRRGVRASRQRSRRGRRNRSRARSHRGGGAAGPGCRLPGRGLAPRGGSAGSSLPRRTRLPGHLPAGRLAGRRLPLRSLAGGLLPAGRLPFGFFLRHGLTPSSSLVWKPNPIHHKGDPLSRRTPHRRSPRRTLNFGSPRTDAGSRHARGSPCRRHGAGRPGSSGPRAAHAPPPRDPGT